MQDGEVLTLSVEVNWKVSIAVLSEGAILGCSEMDEIS
jgi:hypothetical protein